MGNTKEKKQRGSVLARNKKAFHDYEVLDTYEMGVVLTGAEVKSIRNGGVNLKDSFVKMDGGELWLWNCHISQWKYSNNKNYDPTRRRKLLAKRREIDSITGKAREKNLTLIPLKLYLKRGLIKVKVGLCRGLRNYDKKAKERSRRLKRELHKEKRKHMV